ncbi:unnamed protein product [Penicillium salamii]|uniref:F-box domain-containing protein n=1 Tax=Penicillium salamii TaxID=1612424 RepID=A0A9W4NPP8_9EURO|nr:unnamed protein product [Penicillium salamii]CAG8122546.1 unnamed protein product [Penicillium salamii]CAG8135574.1 unnamed protein product [Penicillium salamii]CAG8302726.1 unnamed protein product [Penicillium salamii]CAG8317136.1 unnamed protein product [Penicillium salamii]
MQPEPTPVSQHTPPVDSSPINRCSTQHGHDLDDAEVSGFPRKEASDPDVSSMPSQNNLLPSVNDDRSAPPSVQVNQHVNAGSPPRKPVNIAPRVAFAESSETILEAFPNEVLTHILSHLSPESLSAITLVSRRFHALVTTPHAWRVAFSRFFPGPRTVEDGRRTTVNEADVQSDRRFFTRLTALASWRSEYILRTRLMRSLSRGKPAQFDPTRTGHVRSVRARHGSAVATYTSQLQYPVSHIHATFNPEKDPLFIHGAAEQGIASASDPSTVKVGTWGISDHQMFRHFADLFPGEAQYGLGSGDLVGMPNLMDVSQPYGMIYGEGCPQGRSYFISTTEQRGRFLGASELGSHPPLGIPAVNLITQATCSVWIAKSSHILKITQGLIGMMSGSSSGVLTAYSIGPHPVYDRRYAPGQVTARWVLCPGVPIIGIAVDDQFSPKRHSDRRIWAVALNALGEIFYLTEVPRAPEIPLTAKLNAEQLDEIAWITGRTVYWEMVESSRRVARPDPFNRELVDGSYSPRSSSNSMGLSENQIAAETKEIEKFISFKPKYFRKACESWDMERDLKVDFAGGDGRQAGESIIVIARGSSEDKKASIRRFTRISSQSELRSSSTPDPPLKATEPPKSLFGGPVDVPTPTLPTSLPPSRASAWSKEKSTQFEWRISDLDFGDRKSVEVTTSALDVSTFATLTVQEDPLLAMSGSSYSSASSSPMLPHMDQPRSALEVPGQRARYLAVGTSMGSVYVWDIRAPAAQSADVVKCISPLRIIHTESPRVSCLGITSLYLVHGGNDGLVQAWDPLASSTKPIRTISSRFSQRARRQLIQAEASVLGVGNNYYATGAICLDTDPAVLRGMVSLGTHLRYWSYSSSGADKYKTSKRRLRRLMRTGNGGGEGQRFNNSGRGAIDDFIEDERVEMQRQKIADEKERAHLSARFGVDLLGSDIDEEQLLAYAQLLSEEAFSSDVAKTNDSAAVSSSVTSASFDTVGPSSFGHGEISSSSSPCQEPADETVDDELAEAIRLSLLDEQHASYDATPSIPIKYAKGVQRRDLLPDADKGEGSGQQEMDDLEFAIQLSLAEGKSREEEQEWEQFPALAPSSPAGKGKGKARA